MAAGPVLTPDQRALTTWQPILSALHAALTWATLCTDHCAFMYSWHSSGFVLKALEPGCSLVPWIKFHLDDETGSPVLRELGAEILLLEGG